jgi:O-antigen ligase
MSKIKTLHWWLTCACVFLIPLTQYIGVRLLVVTAVVSLFAKFNFRTLPQRGWDIWLYLGVLALGLLYSDDTSAGLRTLETSLSLLALPIIFNALDSDKNKIRLVYYSFVFGLLAASFICVGSAFYEYRQTGNPDLLFFEQLTDVLSYQPTYLAYYLILSIGFTLYALFYHQSKLRAYMLMVIVLFSFMVLMLSGGRTAFISVLLIFSFFILKYLLEERTAHKNLVFALVAFMTLSLFVVNSIEYWNVMWPQQSDYWERNDLWESAIKANPDPILGVGTGDDRQMLNQYYKAHGLEQFAANNYNAHNQFLQTYLTNGLLGLLAMLIMVGRPLYFALRSGDTQGILIYFPFLIYGMTEVFLGRYQGVVFFGLVHQLLIARYYIVKEERLLKVE